MTTADAAGLLEDLTRRGVVLTAEADKLRYRAPKGTVTPALRELIEQHRAVLLQVLGTAGASSTGPADGPAIGLPKVRHEKRAPAGPADLAQPVAGESAQMKHEKSALAEPDQVAHLEAELEGLLGELGQVAGSWADLPAYRRFCELERQWLDLRGARVGSSAGQAPAVTQDPAPRRAPSDPARARLDQLLQPKPGGLTPAEVAEVRALAQACGVKVRLECWNPADPTAGWQQIELVGGR